MAMQIGMAEWIDKVGQIKNDQVKIQTLRDNNTIETRTVFQGIFDPSVIWLLPEGDPPYRYNVLEDQEGQFLKALRDGKLRYFIKGFFDNLKPKKREDMFIQMLEHIDRRDAALLLKMKNKTPPDGITSKHVVKAYPDLIKNGYSLYDGRTQIPRNSKGLFVKSKNESGEDVEDEQSLEVEGTNE